MALEGGMSRRGGRAGGISSGVTAHIAWLGGTSSVVASRGSLGVYITNSRNSSAIMIEKAEVEGWEGRQYL
ncbi:hypothetical protein O3P69_019937 [Scylla paramamosain]|uniref:Uncharacterized protein n=1 Tax=Scylla paramamosain TaxID=85552 RepID=A0AAW0SIA2_SCYPA